MGAKRNKAKVDDLRVSAMVVMNAADLHRAKAKASQHDMPFPEFLERAVRMYGKFLDKKITAIARPI